MSQRPHTPIVPPRATSAEAAAKQLYFWRTTAVAALILVVILAVLNWVVRRSPPAPAAVTENVVGAASTSIATPRLMPWGRLLTESIIMERPDGLFSDPDVYFETGLPWRFGKSPKETVTKLLQEAGLPSAPRAWLLDGANWQLQGDEIVVVPPSELLFNLTADSRACIYSFLAQIPGNRFKNDPFKIATNLAPMWFEDAGVSVETERLIRSLTYRRGPMVCFSDLGLLADRIPTTERRAVLKALSRLPAQRAFLRIEHGDDLGAVANYWAAAGRMPDMLPLLDSLRHSPDGGRVDLAYLLPRFCRERLYTFPDHATQLDAGAVDCFWTALNFFRYPPEQRFIDVASRMGYLRDQYEVHVGEPALGDIMAFYNTKDEPVHACVYIAGDLVFTKNGATVFSPWLLMSYRDMLAYYSVDAEPKMRVLRARKSPQS